jgi:hypothetical protein
LGAGNSALSARSATEDLRLLPLPGYRPLRRLLVRVARGVCLLDDQLGGNSRITHGDLGALVVPMLFKEGLNKELGIDIPVKLHQPATL